MQADTWTNNILHNYDRNLRARYKPHPVTPAMNYDYTCNYIADFLIQLNAKHLILAYRTLLKNRELKININL